MPRNNRIGSCDTAHVPAQWMKLSWFPWGSEKGLRHARTHTHTLASVLYKHIHTSFHIAPPSISATILGRYSDLGLAQPSPPHRISAQDTGPTQRWHRGSIILTTWLQMGKMTAFKAGYWCCAFHLWEGFQKLLSLQAHFFLCAVVFPHT